MNVTQFGDIFEGQGNQLDIQTFSIFGTISGSDDRTINTADIFRTGSGKYQAFQWRMQDFPERSVPTPDQGAPTYYLTNFS